MVKLFLDTEFTDLRQDCELISIGIVADAPGFDSKPVFYAESIDFSEDKCSDFVRENILPNLQFEGEPKAIYNTDDFVGAAICGTEEDICMHLLKWLHMLADSQPDPAEKFEVYSDCLAYDWILFCKLFEHSRFPSELIYYIPFDISTIMKVVGVDPDINREEFASGDPTYKKEIEQCLRTDWAKHNSLFDALVIYYCYNVLNHYL